MRRRSKKGLDTSKKLGISVLTHDSDDEAMLAMCLSDAPSDEDREHQEKKQKSDHKYQSKLCSAGCNKGNQSIYPTEIVFLKVGKMDGVRKFRKLLPSRWWARNPRRKPPESNELEIRSDDYYDSLFAIISDTLDSLSNSTPSLPCGVSSSSDDDASSQDNYTMITWLTGTVDSEGIWKSSPRRQVSFPSDRAGYWPMSSSPADCSDEDSEDELMPFDEREQ